MQPDLGFQFDYTGRDLDQPKAQRVELRDPPGRALWHGGAQGPEQPAGPGLQEQAELIISGISGAPEVRIDRPGGQTRGS